MRIQLPRRRIPYCRTLRAILATAAGSSVAFAAPLALGQVSEEPKSKAATSAGLTTPEPAITEQTLAANAGDLYGDALERPRRLGLMFDLGSLDGAMLSLVYRPLPWLRMYGGGGTNGAAPGLRLGASVAPLQQRHWALNLDGGHFFEGDVNGIFSAIVGASYDHSRALEHFDYDFVNLQAGWEAESNGLLFFVRGGVGFVWSQIPPDGLSRLRHVSSLVAADGSVQAFLPSLQVGLIGFF